MGFKTTKVSQLPMCDICSDQGMSTVAQYDGKTVYGWWANMCQAHWKRVGIGLGLGIGQRLIIERDSNEGA